MKFHFKLIASVILILLILVCSYQIYWLINFYNEQYEKTEAAIDRVIDESPYKELAVRVAIMTAEQEHWKDMHKENPDTETDKPYPDEASFHADMDADSTVQKTADSILKDFLEMESMLKLTLFKAIDTYKPVDMMRFDSIINADLSIYNIPYALQCRNNDNDSLTFNINRDNIDTKDSKAYILSTYSDDSSTYTLYLQNHKWYTLRSMWPLVAVSVLMVVLLIISYIYLFKIIIRQKTVDEIKSDFINNMTHELKTPISVTYAAVDALQNFGLGDDAEKRNTYLAISKEQLMYLNSLVEQILTMSVEERKNLKMTLSTISVSEVFEKHINQFELNAPKPVKFIKDIKPEALTIEADGLHFGNIISNLIENAIKYSNEKVTIRLSASVSGNKTVISLCDNGIGIPQGAIDKIFDKFYRVSTGNVHNVKGYGLGLFYVKTITDKHGWEIKVESRERKGSCFKIIIP